MAHQFSVEIHDFLTARIDAAERALEEEKASPGSPRAGYLEGRLVELRHARQLLSAKYDLRFHKYY